MSKLYVIPTPIGNLEDMTLRGLRLLKEADCILSEDTRTTRHLLQHFGIDTLCLPYHKFNEHAQLESYVQLVRNHASVALVSDAGTPGISDPGFLLVRECVRNGILVECLPGATALIPALVDSGIPCDRFFFYGFLPHKKGRQTALARLSKLEETFVLYESPYRLLKTLEQLREHCGAERQVCVCRELTKIYEESVRGSIGEVQDYFSRKGVKGEIVMVVQGCSSEASPESSLE